MQEESIEEEYIRSRDLEVDYALNFIGLSESEEEYSF